MNTGDDLRGILPEGEPSSSKEVEQLKSQMQDMQLEIDILKETLNVLKKTGVDMTALRNREKAVMADALKDNYSLPLLFQKLSLPKSSYYYQRKQMKAPDKYELLRKRIFRII